MASMVCRRAPRLPFAPLCHLAASCLLGLLVLGCPDKGPGRGPSSDPDARARSASGRDSGPPVAPRAIGTIDLGSGCSCDALPTDVLLAHVAARRALVSRMDSLNEELRKFMEALDKAIGPKDAPLSDPSPHQVGLRGLGCRLDCLLHQFLGFTRPAWGYLEQVARFLDRAGIVVARLALPLEPRPAGPGAEELTAVFNEVVRRSNHSIGLQLLAPLQPRPTLGLDSLAFGAKIQRWALVVAEILAARLVPWSAPAGETSPSARARAEPVSLRVALARLRQEIGEKGREGKSLKCEKGEACAVLAPRLGRALAALEELGSVSSQMDELLRKAAGPHPEAAALEKQWRAFQGAMQAWEKARSALAGAR
ncbi:MAG: hypothetical protein RBU30_01685 [Polyangia bacterium]|nr:hypothetical protein [Polyangia bacterium]